MTDSIPVILCRGAGYIPARNGRRTSGLHLCLHSQKLRHGGHERAGKREVRRYNGEIWDRR